jgi:predicted ATPase/DNA-binding SARP family transcriptional activator
MAAPESTTSPLTIRLFGPLEIRRRGAPLPRFRSRKSQWLLALLLLRHGRDVARTWLAGMLWPDRSERESLALLRRELTDLRRVLGPDAGYLSSPTLHTLCLDLAGAEVDLLAFDAAIAHGDTTSLEQAVSLYGGALLEGCEEEWIIQEREAREQAYLSALERLAAEAGERGEHAAARDYLRRTVAVEPLRESAQRALMATLAAEGSYAAAGELYRELRLRLYRELNTEPAPETTALYRQIRAGAKERGRERETRPSGLSLSPSLPLPLPPPRLPQPLTPLVGREQALREVKSYLATSRLVTLTGTGGIGKTRLAIQIAAEVAGDYPDGVWFVELGALTDPMLVPQAVASALGVRERSDRPLPATLQELLREKELLLVLDNCEHLIEACAQLAETLLCGCPQLRILATSRQPLGLTGEVTWRVPSLSLPQSGVQVFGCSGVQAPTSPFPEHLNIRTPEHPLMASEAVRLFVERAGAVAPGFTLTERNAPAVGQVCRRLDGIPLAIELAAARVRALPVEQIVTLLDQPFRLLTGGGRTAPPRHQTLRATIDWSYKLLSEPERALLERLAVFAGGFTLEATEAVCSDFGFGTGDVVNKDAQDKQDEAFPSAPIQNPKSKIQNLDVLDLLSALVDKDLVVYEERQESARYRLLETIRQFGWDRLRESGEAEHVRRRHRDWCLQLAEQAAPELLGPEQAMWFERLEREHDNLRAAIEWSRDRGSCSPAVTEVPPIQNPKSKIESPEAALRLGGALSWFWLARGYVSEGRKRLAELLALPGAETCTSLRAKALKWAGVMADAEGDPAAARALLEESLTILRALDDKKLIAWSLISLGQNAQHQGEYATARAVFEECLAIQRDFGDKLRIAGLMTHLGDVVGLQGDYETARALCKESLALYRDLGRKRGIAWSCHVLGRLARVQGDTATARALLEESLALFQELGLQPSSHLALDALGEVARDEGDLIRARSLYDASLAIGRAGGHQRSLAAPLAGLGAVAAAEGNFLEACSFYKESLTLCQEMGDKRGVAISLEGLAAGYLRAERGSRAASPAPAERAARLFAAAEALREVIGAPLDPCERANYERQVAAARARAGKPKFAAAWAEGRTLTLEAAVREALDTRD